MRISFRNRTRQKPDLQSYSDTELISYYVNEEDQEAVGILFTRYSHLVYGVCLKYLKNENDAQDAVMDIFEKLMKDLKSHHIKNFKSWLYSVSKNFCLMELRKTRHFHEINNYALEKLSEEFMDSGIELHPNSESGPENRIEKMLDAVNKLNHEQKQCIELLYLNQKSYKEVMHITGYSMNQVKSYIQNGKRNLKNLLTEK